MEWETMEWYGKWKSWNGMGNLKWYGKSLNGEGNHGMA